MLAAHLDNLLFLLLIAVALLFQFLAKAAGKAGKDQTRRTSTPGTSAPTPRAPTESDEERVRKFLEALGQPPTSRPPPPVLPRTNIPARPLAPVQPPMAPLSQLRREKPPKRETIPSEISPQPVRGPAKVVPPTFEVREGPLPIAPPIIKAPGKTYEPVTSTIVKAKEPGRDIATLLASTSRLRDAIILREILGPPRGLQALDLMDTA
jgi:hypothetical protein